MRIRTIKPEFFLHSDLFDAEKETGLPLRVAFAGLWCAADREGRFKWEARRLGVSILPYDNIDFSRVLDALVTRAFLVQYRVNDEVFGFIPSWKKHQYVNPREAASILPEPNAMEILDASVTREPRVDHASRKEGKGKERKELVASVPPPSDDDWIASLKTNPAYVGINVPIEVAKCQSWCDANRKQASRRRIINWLNRSERPVAFGSGSQLNGQSKDVYKEPSWDWQTAIREKWPLSDYPGRVRWEEGVWGNVPLDRRAEILRGR